MMARVRHVYSHGGMGTAMLLGGAIASIAPHYERALATVDLRGPLSTVGFMSHVEPERAPHDVLVLVYVDRPEDHEIIIVKTPRGLEEVPAPDLTHLATQVIDAGLTRLGQARGWDPKIVAAVLAAGRSQALEREEGATVPWVVHAEGRGVSAPEQPHELTFPGTLYVDADTQAYDDALDQLLSALKTDAFQEWWRGAPVPIGEVFCNHGGTKAGVTVHLSRRVTANINRPTATILQTDPAAQARADAEALLERIEKRLNLPPAPPLA